MPLPRIISSKKNVFSKYSALIILLLIIGFAPGTSAMELSFEQTLQEAQKGNADASYFLGTMYQTGNGPRQDCSAALKWTTLAAERGHVLAQSHLGMMYMDGCGDAVVQNSMEAYVWLALAAEQGLKFARENLEALKNEMHPYLLAEAQRRADLIKSSLN